MEDDRTFAPSPPQRPGLSPYAFGWIATFAILTSYTVGSGVVALMLTGGEPGQSGLELDSDALIPAILIGQVLFMLVPALMFAWAHPLGFRRSLRVFRPAPIAYVYATLGILATIVLSTTWLILQEVYLVPDGWLEFYHTVMERAEWVQDLLHVGMNVPALLLVLLAGAVAPAVSEEMFFRGIVQRSFESRLKPSVAILTAAAIFGLVHLQPTNLIPLFGIGCFLGFIAWSSQSVWPAVLAHFVHNATEILILNAGDSVPLEPTGRPTADDLLLILPVAAVAGIVMVWIVRVMLRHRHGLIVATEENTQTADPSGGDDESAAHGSGDI